MALEDVTLAKGTIHNPDEARHFMAITPVAKRVRITLGGKTLAESSDAVRLKEVGFSVYEPILYLPRTSILAALQPSERESHCPLKGGCTWYSLDQENGEDIAWSYVTPFDFADAIADLVAFDPQRVSVEEHPL